MRIALDAMGGDRAPAAPVEGALPALDAFADVEVVLVGRRRPRSRPSWSASARPPTQRARLPVEAADHVVAMGEDPVARRAQQPAATARASAPSCCATARCAAS